MERRVRQGWALAIFSLAAWGCKQPAPPPFQVWAEKPAPHRPDEGSGSGFDRLASAALQVERSLPQSQLDRTSFTPGMRARIIRETQSPLATASAGLNSSFEFEFVPRWPFEPAPYHRGWRAVSRALAWRIEEAVATGNYDAAVRDVTLAHRFGFALTGGSISDATLGLTTIDDARRASAPYLNSFGASQLRQLAAGIRSAVEHRPDTAVTLQHEAENMRLAVQYVQDAYRDNDFAELRKRLGHDIRDAIRYLEELRADDAEKRPAYFQGFTDEATERARWFSEAAQKSAAERADLPEPKLASVRPWRRFARHFFTAPEPYLDMLDATLARTRLLALECEIRARVKTTRAAPPTLEQFPKHLTTDPYTGKPFVYRTAGPDYTLYSVGINLRDDGGESDESGTEPDLVVETVRR